MQFVNKNTKETSLGPSLKKRVEKENRKISKDNMAITSANTPKSEKINVIKIEVPEVRNECQSEENKNLQLSSLYQNSIFDKSPQAIKPKNLNELMDDLQESKNWLAGKSPMAPMAALLKKNSSAGETPFEEPNSPKRTGLHVYRTTIGLCEDHFEAIGLKDYIGEYESLSDNESSDINVREFTLGQIGAEDMSDVQSVCNKKILNHSDN